MIRTVYFSTASADLTKDDIAAIFAHAKDANEKRGITGALGYNGRNFCQCLEGDETVVRALITTIANDPRHSGFKVLDEKPITSRHFDGWTMKEVDALDFRQITEAMDT